MSIAKVIEVIAESDESFEQAVDNALEEASKSVKNIQSIWIQDQTALVKNGRIDTYRVNCKVTFVVDS